jgi:hypothetical protein
VRSQAGASEREKILRPTPGYRLKSNIISAGDSIMETLLDFVARLSKDVGCYYHQLQSELYPLKRNNTMQRERMGVFAFVLELRDRFRIHTSEEDANTAGVQTFLMEPEKGYGGVKLALLYM